jgi:hypothetical protein
MPKNDLNCLAFFGLSIFLIAVTFAGSGEMPSFEKIYP